MDQIDYLLIIQLRTHQCIIPFISRVDIATMNRDPSRKRELLYDVYIITRGNASCIMLGASHVRPNLVIRAGKLESNRSVRRSMSPSVELILRTRDRRRS